MKTTNNNSGQKILVSMLLALAFAGLCMADVGEMDPASAFPEDTLFYMEVREPAKVLNTIMSMPFWPVLEEWILELSSSGFIVDAEFVQHFADAAGQHLVVAMTPEPVLAFKGNSNTRQDEALAWFENRMLKNDTTYDLYHAGPWRVITPRHDPGPAQSVAARLAEGTPFPQRSLCNARHFQETMARLPETPDARAYINIPRIAEAIPDCEVLSTTGKRLLSASLNGMDGLGIAREISPHLIRTWMAGSVDWEALAKAFPRCYRSLSQIDDSLMRIFPSTAVASYEVALPLDALFELGAQLLHTVSPGLHDLVGDCLNQFAMAYGHDSLADSLPGFGQTTAMAWLPLSDANPKWPFPRQVTVVRIDDEAKTDRLLADVVDWLGSAIAPCSDGLFGARRFIDEYEGVSIQGIELDSLLPFPMPSPAFARVDNLLIISPVRSAVEEMITMLGSDLPGLELSKNSPPQAMERFYWNPPAWAQSFKSSWELAITGCSLLCLKTRYLCEIQKQIQELNRMGDIFFKFLEHLAPAEGSTVMDEQGRFTFYMELPVR